MTLYSYKATDPSGKIVNATVEAADEMKVADKIHAMGYIPIRIIPAGKQSKALRYDVSDFVFYIFKRISNKDVILFTQDLSSLLEAGLPFDRALSILLQVTEKERFKEVISDVLKIVQGGGYLSDALARHPKVYSGFYVNMVKAGEAGGVLEDVLKRLGIFLENTQDLKDYIKSALVYPVFLLFVGGISVIILMTFVIPKFSIIFSDLGQAMPLSTTLLLGLSEILRSFWWVILGGMVGVYLVFYRFKTTASGRLTVDRYKLNLPVFGELMKKIEVARFARTLGTLIRSGVPILKALDLAKDIIVNKVMAGSMTQIHERVKEGERLSKSLEDTKIFPSLAVQMITVGEETGRLEEMLIRVAENYEKILRNTIKRLISLLEPAMILGMGLVVGFIVISMLMAIFSMNDMPF
jgi:type II secretion system protein F